MNGEPKGAEEKEHKGGAEVLLPDPIETPVEYEREPITQAQGSQAVQEIAGAIAPALLSAANAETPEKNIPELDPKKLTGALIVFINRLKGVFPHSKVESITAQEAFLKQVVVEICLVAQELKKVIATPTAGNPEMRAAMKMKVDPAIIEQATSFWREQCSLLADILSSLAQKGPEWIATLSDDKKFTFNLTALQKISALHESMLNAYRIAYNWKGFDGINPSLGLKRKSDLSSRMGKEQKIPGINNEDLVDAQIDENMYQHLQMMFDEQRDPSEIAKWFTETVKINFQHLGNSLAAQKQMVMQVHLDDIESGAAQSPNYFTPNAEESLFESEAYALAFYLCVMNRNAKAIVASQKLASLIQDDA